MKISVCIDAVYHGKDFIAAMEEVKSCGVNRFEFWTWWDKDIEAIVRAKERLGMKTTAICTKFVSLTDASKRGDYLAALEESIEAAGRLGCQKVISQVGDRLAHITDREQRDSLIEGLRASVPLLEKAGITLVFEPLNTLVDHKGYYLWSSDEAFRIHDEVGSPYVKVLFDIYHQQIMEGNLISRITGNLDKIGHFHAAGNPGRHELTTGEIRYETVFTAIRDAGYAGEIGFEYFPLGAPAEGIGEWSARGIFS